MRPRPLPDKDLEVTGVEINLSLLSSDAAETWLDGQQFVDGLNSLIDLFLAWERIKIDLAYKQPADAMTDGMARIQKVLDSLIPELRWRGGLARFPAPCRGHEAQTVNILITSLYIRSNLLQNLGQVSSVTHQAILT